MQIRDIAKKNQTYVKDLPLEVDGCGCWRELVRQDAEGDRKGEAEGQRGGAGRHVGGRWSSLGGAQRKERRW